MNSVQVGKDLQSAYDEMYTDTMTQWRELGGKYKARNLVAVCRNQKFQKVLECGAGEGSVLKFLDEAHVFGELYAIEISGTGIAQIKKRNLPSLCEAKSFNGYEIPYPDKFFDLVYCSHVIEHVEHPRILLRELRRVSSYQAFEIPLDYSTRVDGSVRHFMEYGHINIYTPALFKFLLMSEGYEIAEELLTTTSDEVWRYNWNNQRGLAIPFRQKCSRRLSPLVRLFRRLRHGNAWYRENCYSAYTCLAKWHGEIAVF